MLSPRKAVPLGLVLASSLACSPRAATTAAPAAVPPDVARELDAVWTILESTHAEYDRLMSAVAFDSDEKKQAAATWKRNKDRLWLHAEIANIDIRRSYGQPLQLVILTGMFDDYIDPEPSVFVETTYFPKATKRELVSLAKTRSLDEEFQSALLRFLRAAVAAQKAAPSAK